MDQNFLNLDDYLGTRVSADTERYLWQTGMEASPRPPGPAPRAGWTTSAADITKIDVPTLIIHGTADRILPIDGQGRRLHAALPDAQYVEIEGGPHLNCLTHAEEANAALLAFLPQRATSGAQA